MIFSNFVLSLAQMNEVRELSSKFAINCDMFLYYFSSFVQKSEVKLVEFQVSNPIVTYFSTFSFSSVVQKSEVKLLEFQVCNQL